jgi:hypothetical protein
MVANTIVISNTTTINGVRTDKQIVIPTSQKYHLFQHLDYINWPKKKPIKCLSIACFHFAVL